MQKHFLYSIQITLIAIAPLFAELIGDNIPKNDRIYLGQTSDFFCPVPSDSTFKVIFGVSGGLNGFYQNGLLGTIPAVADGNLFILLRLIGRHQIQLDGGYYGFEDWQSKADIGINYIYDFSVPLAGGTYIAVSPGVHFLGSNKAGAVSLEDGQGTAVYEPDVHTDVFYRTNLNSIVSCQLKVRVSKLFGIVEPFVSMSIYYHQERFGQNGSYYYQNKWNYTGNKNIDYQGTGLAVHTGLALTGRNVPVFLNFSVGINPGYTKPFNNIPSPVSLSVGYRFNK